MLNNDALDFQDSEVSSAKLQGQSFLVRLSAGHVRRSRDQDGVESVGFIQSLQLTILNSSVVHIESGCVGRIALGALRVGGMNIGLVPVPYKAEASVELELVFSNGSMCKVFGKGITLKSTGETRFVEWLKC